MKLIARPVILALLTLATPAVAQEDPVFAPSASWEVNDQGSGRYTLLIKVSIDKGWHINSNAPLDSFLIPTTVRLDAPAGWQVGTPVFPRHRLARLGFSEGDVAVFERELVIRVPVTVGPTATGATLGGAVEAQACNDEQCIAPTEVAFTAPALATAKPANGGGSESSSEVAAGEGTGLLAHFRSSGLALQLILVFLAGLALNLTPCVFPLIPITVGFFLAQKESGRSTWLLAVVYVLGMSVTYSALGVAAALTGSLFGSALQSPWVVGAIAAVLLALATSMFGLWEFRVPGWVNSFSGGRAGLGGALVMGLVVGLVAAPCIGPFVLGLLTYVGRQQDPWLGFLLFFVLSLGLGVPYLLLGVFTKAVDRLPNSGAWMLGVRQLFGVILVAMAAYFVAPLVPGVAGAWLLPGALLLGGLYLLLVARPGHEQPAIDRVMRGASAAILVAGVLLAPRGGAEKSGTLEWEHYDEARVGQAIASGQPVILDFYADWCLPCKELDTQTFSDPRVSAALGGLARFKVDLTRSNDATDAIRTKWGVAGVPTIALFVKGQEVGAARLTGFEPPEEFLKRLASVTAR